jgi:phage repressor protein C with HTH and peptisase S24 domain
MNTEAGKILIDARKKKGWTQAEMAERLGEKLNQTYSTRQYSKLEDGLFPKYKTEIAKALDDILGTNLYRSIYEQEQNVLNSVEEPAVPFLEKRRGLKAKSDPYMVPLVPVKAQAGYVKAVDQEVFMDTLEKYALPPGVNPHGAIWRYWEVEGESMEPAFHSGDIILTSQVHPYDWENLRNFYLYVIVTRDRVLFKRLYCKNMLEWVLISENEEHTPQRIISAEDVKEVWVYRRSIVNKAPPTKVFEIKV